MRKQQPKARSGFNLIPSRFSSFPPIRKQAAACYRRATPASRLTRNLEGGRQPSGVALRGAFAGKLEREGNRTLVCSLGSYPSLSEKEVSCKTGRKRTEKDQRVSSAKQNADFEPLWHSVCIGRHYLGRYERVATSKYAAYGSSGELLGRFKTVANARKAFAPIALSTQKSSADDSSPTGVPRSYAKTWN
jgi:hypothetical protein